MIVFSCLFFILCISSSFTFGFLLDFLASTFVIEAEVDDDSDSELLNELDELLVEYGTGVVVLDEAQFKIKFN